MKKKMRKNVRADFVSDIDAITDPIEKSINIFVKVFPDAKRPSILENLYGLCVVLRPEEEDMFLREWRARSMEKIGVKKSAQEKADLSCMLLPIPIWRMAISALISTYDPSNPKHVACVDSIMKDGPAVDSVKKAVCRSILGRMR